VKMKMMKEEWRGKERFVSSYDRVAFCRWNSDRRTDGRTDGRTWRYRGPKECDNMNRSVQQMGCGPPHGHSEFTILKDKSKRWSDSLPNVDDTYGHTHAEKRRSQTDRQTDWLTYVQTDRKLV
jgi:hypothetical protein